MLSIRFEESGYLGKAPTGGWKKKFPLVIPLLPLRINWLQTEFSGLNFCRWSLYISLLCNNCLTDRLFPIKIFHLLTFEPAPWVSQKKSSETTCGYKLPKFELVCSWKLFCCLKMYEMYAGMYDKTMSLIFIKTCL